MQDNDDPLNVRQRSHVPLQQGLATTLTTGDPQAGAEGRASLLGSLTRADGSTQVTDAGHPLYTFHGYAGTPADRKPGDLHGQGSLGLWWVLTTAGKKITKAPHT